MSYASLELLIAFLLLLQWLAFAAACHADIPPGGTDSVDPSKLRYLGTEADGKAELPAADDRTAPIRLTTLRKTASAWSLQLQTRNTHAIDEGDLLLFTARIRAISTESETGDARLEIVFEQTSSPYSKSLNVRVGHRPGDDWTTIYFPFKAHRSFAPGEAHISMRPGFGPQVLEISDVRVINYRNAIAIDALPRTRLTYAGREANAQWRADALARIERIRKGELRIRVVDGSGRAVPDAVVRVQMRRHSYAFGSAIAADLLLKPGADGDRYCVHILRLFNRVVIENHLKWPAWRVDRTVALDALKWLARHNIPVRGHNLVWPSWECLPREMEAMQANPDALRAAVADHITDEAVATRSLVVEWDVVNEPFTAPDLLNVLGDDVMVDWFKLARQADPDAKLYLNDFPSLAGGDHLDHFERTLTRLQSRGAPLDGIGVQCHYSAEVVPPAQLLASLDRFAKFGLPIQATEFDIDTSDEQLQADYLRDHLIAFFSHPATNGVMMWGFWESAHWRPDASLYRRDWSPKPAADVWNELVFKRWWTDESLRTDQAGTCTLRAFHGDHDITATLGDRPTTHTIRLTHDGAELTIELK